MSLGDKAATFYERHDGSLFAAFALGCVVYIATCFYSYLQLQTGGVWSAPLDDVFIHFDYARAFARGYPFHWSEGNGYSSGCTSLTYPIVLAFGYWLGFRGLRLMQWAAIIACASIFVFLLGTGRLLDRQARCGRWLKYLVPPAVLSLGALDWTLFSGMENALHLGIWGICVLAVSWQIEAPAFEPALRRAWLTGVAGALLVATRPESAVCVAAFGCFALWRLGQPARPAEAATLAIRTSYAQKLRLLVAAGLPAVAFLLLHTVANKLFTGEWSANGTIAKLALNNPYMSAGDKWDRYVSLLSYIVPRLTLHHFSEVKPWGLLIPAVGVVPLLFRPTRPLGVLLWSQIVAWMLLISLNNQVRWHNERYAMAAVAWLMVLAAVGLGVLLRRGRGTVVRWLWARAGWGGEPHLPRAVAQALRLAFGCGLAAIYWVNQEPRMRDQVWFFGRAGRNILDQHVTAGKLLKQLKARRVLVGDAGALIYASDLPGLDIIGLGGFHSYPFARAGVHGQGASLELIERIPIDDRPDYLAIYPSWWGDLPTYFGRYVTEVPVAGNVICGGSEKVIYRADWDALDRTGAPRSKAPDERIADELDVADLISERAHGYRFPQPSMGFVKYLVLNDPADQRRDLFDAGRRIPKGQSEHATLQPPAGDGRLLVRVAPERRARIRVEVNGTELGVLTAKPEPGLWQELSLPLGRELAEPFALTLTPLEGESVHFHIWVLAKDPSKQPQPVDRARHERARPSAP